MSCSVFERSIYFQQCLEKVLRAELCWIISVIVGISFYIKVSVQITHHVGNETEEQANQDKLAESGIPVELADPQPASSEFREGEEQVTLEYDPETQTVQIQRAETVRNSSEQSFINKCIEKSNHIFS